MTAFDAETVQIFDKLAAVAAGEKLTRCIAAYAELLAASICALKDSPEEALARFRTDVERTIVERFEHYRSQLGDGGPDLPQTDLFSEVAVTEPQPVIEPAAPVEPEQPLVGWPRARALRDTADYLASCRDSGDQIAIGCVYPWMRDLVVETLRAESAVLTEATVANWDAELGLVDRTHDLGFALADAVCILEGIDNTLKLNPKSDPDEIRCMAMLNVKHYRAAAEKHGVEIAEIRPWVKDEGISFDFGVDKEARRKLGI